ncbi:MAG: PhoH family protein [Candidatus Omnitrophica bacterium]|nr:PhoH family protein [Candidatus Omnitrophota bacterium]
MEKEIRLNNDAEAKSLFGRHDENLKLVEDAFKIQSLFRGGILKISGEKGKIEKAARVIEEFLTIIREGGILRKHDVSYAISAIKKNQNLALHDIYLDKIRVSSKRQYVTPKSKGQKEYVDAIRKYDIVFAIGPAGTGKTYLAMAMAVNALNKRLVSRIILARPAVEAGESLGFLPGTLYEKVSPYLRPIYDALYDMVEPDRIQDYIDRGIIEVAPLAYMRGRTLNDSFIILDEAQNSTPEQMKMFLTRLGFDSKTVITGDITQSDLPKGKISGLVQSQTLLKNIEGIKFVYLQSEDVVRHELVQEIIKAYELQSKGSF